MVKVGHGGGLQTGERREREGELGIVGLVVEFYLIFSLDCVDC